MADLSLTLKRLREERAQVVSQVAALDAAIAALEKAFGASEAGAKEGRTRGRKRRLSAAAREKIASAQRARWARVRQQKSTGKEKKAKAAA